MLFNSAIFLILFVVFYLAYWPLPVRGKHILIIIASFIFYGWYSFPFLLLFLFILFFSYYISIPIVRHKSKAALAVGVGLLVLNLAFFKYFYLFAAGLGHLFGLEYLIDIRRNLQGDYGIEIILPIAISFYTFQIIAYLVDCYRGTISEQIILRKYIVFILYFPQFIAGPIMRSTDFIEQIDQPRATEDRMLNGSLLLLQGIFKKVLIADQIGAVIGPVFQRPESYDFTMLIILIPGFISQIYADFSGYTDMARGMSKLLGYEIPENFTGPFLSSSMSELWRRWHITLSTWLRDYIYFPLGGSRRGEAATYINLLVTMGLGGLWHGANWTMLVWGIYMGFIIAVERFMSQNKIRILPETLWAEGMRKFWTWFLFGISGILFASPGIEQAFQIFGGIAVGQRGSILARFGLVIVLCIVVLVFNYLQYSDRLKNWLGSRRGLRYALVGLGSILITLLVGMYGDTSGSFIYFSF
ncbi:MAG: MBOAT family protein [Leptospiraceae bacterium]|nr:MBOAT family protein [Leptospiraceae bacterium]